MNDTEWECKCGKVEDYFKCHKCHEWYPWYYFTKGYRLAFQFSTDDDNTFAYISGEKDRGGRRWACNTCVYKIVCDYNILIVQ